MITTFYSFKGGVGRSMAMANVAFELASRGLRVLAIDFDLEAPGLERYFRVPVGTVHATAGVIDLIEQYKRALSGRGDIGPEAEFRQLARYICPIAEFGGRGRLDLMPAGRRASEDDRRAYALAVRTFDWQDFYFNWEGEAFFEWLRRQLVGPDGQGGLYDVVLADSRTGVTEMGGVCACQLADVVVMLTAANHQNIEGTRELAADLASPAVRTLRRNRPPLQIVVVPARVEQRAPDRLADFIGRFDAAFGSERPEAFAELGLSFHDLALPYVPEFAFEEQVTERTGAEAGALTDAFRRLADALLVLAGPGVPQDLRDAARASLQPAQAQPAAAAKVERAFDPTTRFAGFDAYLSCAHAARETVEPLADWLRAEPRSLRVQLAETYFDAGADLQAATAELMHHTQALVLLVGEQGVTRIQRAELGLARSMPSPPRIVQVLLPGAADDAFAVAFGQSLSDAPMIDLRRGLDDDAALQVLWQALRAGSGNAPDTTFTGQDLVACPFPGATAFGESDAAMFGGRDEALAALKEALAGSRRVLVEGPSGSGKTSLVMAALWPALRGEGRDLVRVDLRETPGPTWSREIAGLPADTLLLVDHADEGDRAELQQLAALCKDGPGPALLVVWRGAPLALAEADQLAAWKDAPARAHTQRDHALHHGGPPGGCSTLLEALQGMTRVVLAPLDAAAQRRAVERMLGRAGRRAETGLLERLFGDTGPTPSMALVQRVLAALWPLQSRGWLTNEAYERIGGADALYGQALEALRSPADDTGRRALDAVLRRLVAVGGSETLIARTMDWLRECTQPVFEGRGAATAQALARHGLVRVSAVPDGRVGGLQLALAHEPRRCVPLARVARPEAASQVLTVARSYAAWCDASDDEAADARVEEIPLDLLQPWLAQGEWHYAKALQVQRRKARNTRRVIVLALGGGIVLAGVIGYWRTSTVQAEVAVVARTATDRAAELAAREQTSRVQMAPVAADAVQAPVPAGRTRVVVHRSGGTGVDASLAKALVAALPADHFDVDPSIEAVAGEICGDVRFHQPQDVDRAREALDRLNQALQGRGDARRLELNDRSQTRAAGLVGPGAIEVWLPPLGDWPGTRQDPWGESRLIPPGCAVVGSDAKGREALAKALQEPLETHFASEWPLRRIWLPAYYIGRHEVTMAQFDVYQQECKRSRGAGCPAWLPKFVDAAKEPNRPAVWLDWSQADAYCRWAGGRLPTEQQWEKAARGADGRFWPWGERPDEQRFQGRSQPRRQPVDVGSLPAGDSPYGIADMAGNVWEWTADLYAPGSDRHTIRGGSYLNSLMQSRSSVRADPTKPEGSDFMGFRCVVDVER